MEMESLQHKNMKKNILFLLLLLNVVGFAQGTKVRDLPEITTGVSGDFLIKDNVAGTPGSTKKISVGNFIATYSLQGAIIATSPLSINTNTLTISQATTANSGYLSNTDFSLFNGKVSTLAAGTNIILSQSANTYTITAGGSNNLSTEVGSVAFGFGANTFSIIGRKSYSSSNYSVQGDLQGSTYILSGATTDATAKTLTTNRGAAATTNQVILENNSAVRFKGTIVGKKTGATDAAAWDIDGLIVRGVNAAATTLIIGNINIVNNAPAWGTPTLAADVTNGGVRVQATGIAATNIMWVCRIETTEVIY